MANHCPDAETARDLEALPADLQALYQRLAQDGQVWQAASAERLASLVQSLVADIEQRMADGSGARDATTRLADSTAPITSPAHPPLAHPARRHRREWLAGTVAAVGVVALLALVLQSALVGREATTHSTSASAGHWQILDRLTWRRISSGQMLPAIAPGNPQVVYEVINPVRPQPGYPGTSATASSLRRTDDGGKSWHDLSLPLPDARISSVAMRVSPLQARTAFLSVWDLSTDACGPYEGVAGMECQRGYVSTDGGATWQTQKLPVGGVLDTGGPIVAQDSRLYARTACHGDGCARLVRSDNGGLAWNVVDVGIVASKQHLCDFAATASGQTIYAVASQVACTEPQSSKTLWRSDDAGATWTQLDLPHRAPFNQSFTLLSNSVLTSPGMDHSSLLYLSKPYITTNAGPSFEYSEDSGATWKATPAVPDVALCASPSEGCDASQPMVIGEAAVLSGGSLFYLPFSLNKPLIPYVWAPGASAWQHLPQLPAEVTGPGSIIVTPGADGHDTITMALRANGDASNPIAYYVVRYQM